MDEAKRIKRLKEMERLNGSDPHELKSSTSGLMTGLATLFVIGLALIVGMILAAYWQSGDASPTPIATSAWHVTQPLLATPTLAPSREWTLATVAPTPVPTWTAVPSSTPVPTWTTAPTQTPAPTWTPYPTLTAAPTWTPAATWTAQATHTAAPTYTPYPSPTAVPATETPTAIPSATATAAPTLVPPMLPPGPGPEVVVVESGGDGWLSYLLAVIDLALVVYIFYQLWSMRRSPAPATPLPPQPLPTNGAITRSQPTPLQTRRVTESSASSRRVEPVQPVQLSELIQEVQLPFSKDRPPDDTERAYIRRRYAETGNLTAVCMEVYNSKGGKVWAWIKAAIEERPAAGQGGRQPEQSQPAPKRPKRPFFVNTSRGRMEV